MPFITDIKKCQNKQNMLLFIWLMLLLKAVLFPNKLLNKKPKNSSRNKTANLTKWTKVLNEQYSFAFFSCGFFLSLMWVLMTLTQRRLCKQWIFYFFFQSVYYDKPSTYLLLTEFSVSTVSYGPSFFALGPLVLAEKTRIGNLQYRPRKRG